MTSTSTILIVLVLAGAGYGLWDITKTEQRTVVIYTTPALRDLLEKDIIPSFERATDIRVAPVYVAAGQQYNRLRMSGNAPEADLFVQASPFYLEKGYDEGRVTPLPLILSLNGSFTSREVGDGGRIWHAFAWSPLVVVVPAGSEAPDLATTDARFGFPHPLLSNNGAYVVSFFEGSDPAVGERLLGQTRVQPTNARANIGGVGDGSFDLTLGYEAVARFYQAQGARIAFDVPEIRGEAITTRVIFSAALIEGDRHPGSERFLRYLLSDQTQNVLAKHSFRPVVDGADPPPNALDVSHVRIVEQDWSQWAELEGTLPKYEVKV